MAANDSLLDQTPALQPPPGVVPNFSSSYVDLQPIWLILLSVTIALTTFIIGARLLAKYHDSRLLQLEDRKCFQIFRSVYDTDKSTDVAILTWVSQPPSKSRTFESVS